MKRVMWVLRGWNDDGSYKLEKTYIEGYAARDDLIGELNICRNSLEERGYETKTIMSSPLITAKVYAPNTPLYFEYEIEKVIVFKA